MCSVWWRTTLHSSTSWWTSGRFYSFDFNSSKIIQVQVTNTKISEVDTCIVFYYELEAGRLNTGVLERCISGFFGHLWLRFIVNVSADENRHVRVMKHVITNTAHEGTLYWTHATWSSDYHGNVFLFCDPDDLSPWRARHLLHFAM